MVESARSVGPRVAVDPRVLDVSGVSSVHGPVTTPSRDRRWMTHRPASWVDQFGCSACVVGWPLRDLDHSTPIPPVPNPSFKF